MLRVKRIVLAFGLFALTAGLVGLSSVSADEPQAKGKKGFDNKKAKTDEPKATSPGDGKTIVIQIDASKLPPDVLKQLLALGTTSAKPEPGKKMEPGKKGASTPPPAAIKAISLAEALAIAEKTAKARATKAEQKDGKDGTVQFKVELTDAKGGKTKLTLDASGKVTETEKNDEDKDKKKKKE